VSVPNSPPDFETVQRRRLTRTERRELRVLETLPFPLTPDQIARKIALAMRADALREDALARQDRHDAWMQRWHLDTLLAVTRFVVARCCYLVMGGVLGVALFLPWQERRLAEACTALQGEELQAFLHAYDPLPPDAPVIAPLLPGPSSRDALVPSSTTASTHVQVLVCRW
jgi:hypothetical protein